MKHKKLFFNILFYLSIFFLVWFLFRFDYVSIQTVHISPFHFILSILLLWLGFYLSTLSWWYILKKHQIKVSRHSALVSHGLSVFAKYIPGKIWVVLGRASKVSGKEYSLKITSYASLKEQFLYVWTGLLLSSIPLFFYRGIDLYSISVTALFILFSFLNFSDAFRRFLIWSFKRVFKKSIDLPAISFKESLKVIALIAIYWFAWIIGFYFLSLSLYSSTTLQVGFVFPLSVTLGLLAIVVPGGIGIREGVLTGFLVLIGIPIEISTGISIISRLWYITGEIFIFITAIVVKNKCEFN